jgi:hypothetical protein
MNLKFGFLMLVSLTLFSNDLLAQEYDGFKGTGTYQRYDKTYINPNLRGKHGFSLGGGIANVSPLNTFGPEYGGHVGYNYLILYKRKRVFGIKEVIRDEVKMGFGAHLYFWSNKEWTLTATYLNPLISMRGKLISLYLFNEVGFGLHSAPAKAEIPEGLRFNLSFEALRIRFGKSPLNLSFTGFYDVSNALLSKNRMDLSVAATLRLYIYKRK